MVLTGISKNFLYKEWKLTLTLSNKLSLNGLEYPFKKNFYQFA